MTQPLPTQRVTVRRADAGDVGAISVLFDAYRQFYEQPADADLAQSYLAARLGADESIVFVAVSAAGDAVGFTQLYPTFCSVEVRPVLVLYDLFVVPDWRRRGVAHALLTQAEHYGRAQHVARLDLSTARTNTRAQALYESLGWRRDNEFYAYSLHL